MGTRFRFPSPSGSTYDMTSMDSPSLPNNLPQPTQVTQLSKSRLKSPDMFEEESEFDDEPSFWRRQVDTFKSSVGVSGSFYNITTAALVCFVVVFLLLVIMRPPMVMRKPSQKELDECEDPLNPPKPCISMVSVVIYSSIAAAIVVAVTMFTQPASNQSPNYVLQNE